MKAISADYFKSLLPIEWQSVLAEEFEQEYFKNLSDFLASEYEQKTIYPPVDKIFSAFQFILPEEVKVVILGQDPYHDEKQANGLAFSVSEGVKIPPSLRNIFKEINSENIVDSGDLSAWAKQGVLLLNTVLSVEAGKANSHRKKGWEQFTTAVMMYLAQREKPLVLMLWGKPAQEKKDLFKRENHLVLTAPHPSPLSAYRGFFGCEHFKLANQFLKEHNVRQIKWQ